MRKNLNKLKKRLKARKVDAGQYPEGVRRPPTTRRVRNRCNRCTTCWGKGWMGLRISGDATRVPCFCQR